MADNNKKQTMYEILGVSQTAALEEIKAAHRARARDLVSGKTGLPADEIKFRLQTLDLALHTLSSQWSRDAYDAELAAPPPHAALATRAPCAVTAPSKNPSYNPIVVATALADAQKNGALAVKDTRVPLNAMSAASSSISALKVILRVIGLIFALIIVFRISSGMFRATHYSEMYAREKAKAEDMLVIQDYYQKHGMRPANRSEAEKLDLDNKRKTEEQQRAEGEKKRQEEEYRRFVESSRYQGEQIHAALQAADERARAEEERARREAEWARQREEIQRQQQAYAEDQRARQREEMQRQRHTYAEERGARERDEAQKRDYDQYQSQEQN